MQRVKSEEREGLGRGGRKRRENEIDSGLPVVRTLGNLPILQVVDTLVPLLLSSPVCQLFKVELVSFLLVERRNVEPWREKGGGRLAGNIRDLFEDRTSVLFFHDFLARSFRIEITEREREREIRKSC